MKQGLIILISFFCIASCSKKFEDNRDDFSGNYQVEQFSETFNEVDQFAVEIVPTRDEHFDGVYIKNFYGAGIVVEADVERFSFVIKRQRIADFIIEGSGRLGVNEIIMSYTVENMSSENVVVDVCTAVLTAY